MKFYIETFGCTANLGNSQDLARALQEMGHIPTSLHEADAVIVNTCAVTEKTQRKVLRRLSLLQGERLIVAGCLSASMPESITGISCRERLGLLNRSSAAGISDLFNDNNVLPHGPFPLDDLCAVVNVAEGCNGSCSYCIVAKARGRLKSRRAEDVVAEVEKLAALGAAEVQISAQDTAAYGSDIGTNLGQLLDRLVEVPGDFMLRVGMMNPNSALLIKDQLQRAYHSPKIYRFLHIPVQSGSDGILRSMGRRYSAASFLNLVSAFRSAHPMITIITDVIVGYPGETEEDFIETLDLIKLLQPDKVNITRFSARQGTPAARLYDMPDRIKKDRSREMTGLWLQIAKERNRRYVGRSLQVLVTERGREGTMKARAKNYLGVLVTGKALPGAQVTVEVIDSNPFYVLGRAVH
ncbi:MAG: tRNA (N(6)-L-threonylcarbamoyladenosine(37)-C(2))-methylthiotransferase [Methanothrix sp.]|nr:tRNA (N(6)-L-threonylcarbamoyladenosine(37)-C(2))-methylthiotransferase [Methanothrix sp.]